MSEMLGDRGPKSVAARLAGAVPPAHGTTEVDRVDRAMLWRASQWLEKEMDPSGAGTLAPPVEEEEWRPEMAHNLLVQFVSFAGEGNTPPPDSQSFWFRGISILSDMRP